MLPFQLRGCLEYLTFKNNIIVFNKTEIEFAIIITKSFLAIPYITHKLRPIINTRANQIDISSDFFDFIIFSICGIVPGYCKNRCHNTN